MTTTTVDLQRVHKVEILISNLLRIGVSLSLFIILVGTVVSFVHHPEYLNSQTSLPSLTSVNAPFPHTLRQVLQGVREFRGQSIVTIGLLVLIATPVLRVAVSIFAFLYQGDRLFMLITGLVLAMLLLSFVLGKAQG